MVEKEGKDLNGKRKKGDDRQELFMPEKKTGCVSLPGFNTLSRVSRQKERRN